MWSTPTDRELAERQHARERQAREEARTPTMSVADRIKRWRRQSAGEETEDVVELICDAEVELRRLTAAQRKGRG